MMATGNIRLQRKYTTSVPAPFREQPTIPHNIGDPLFNAYKDVGRAISGFGAAVGSYAQARESKQNDRDSFEADMAVIRTATEDKFQLAEAMRDAELGDPNFAEEHYQKTRERHQAIMDNFAAQGVDQKILDNMALKFARIEQTIAGSSIAFEEGSKDAKIGQQFVETSRVLATESQQDPSTLIANLQTLKEAYEAMPMEGATKLRLYEQEKQLLIDAAGYGEARTNAQGVVDALSGQGTVAHSVVGPGGINYAAIIHAEGTAVKGNPYDEVLGYGAYGSPPQRLSTMSVGDVARWSRAVILKNHGKSSATGAFQITSTNLREAIRQGIVKDGDIYDAPTQQKIAAWLFNQGGGYANWKGLEGSGARAVKARQMIGDKVYDYIRGGNQVRVGGKTGNFVLDQMTAAQQRKILAAAEANLTADKAAQKADMQRWMDNSVAAAWNAETLNRAPPTYDQVAEIFGVDKADEYVKESKIAEIASAWHGKTPDQIEEELKYIRAQTSPNDPFYASTSEAIALAEKARDDLLKQRKDSPVAYALAHSDKVSAAWGVAESSRGKNATADRRRYFEQLDAYYNQINLAVADRKALTAEQLNTFQNDLTKADPAVAAARLIGLYKEMGPMFDEAMLQLEKTVGPVAATVAEMAAVYPETADAWSQHYVYWRAAQTDKSRLPDQALVNAVISNTLTEGSLAAFKGSAADAVRELVAAAYVPRGGSISGVASSDWSVASPIMSRSLRQLLGGTGDPGTGWIDNQKGAVVVNTVLPPGSDSTNWNLAMERITLENLITKAGGDPDIDDGLSAPISQSEHLTIEDILREGVFVKRNIDQYEIWMQFDGQPVFNGYGRPFTVTLRKEDLEEIINQPSVRTAPGDTPDLAGAVRQRGLERFGAQPAVEETQPEEEQLRDSSGKLLTDEERRALTEELNEYDRNTGRFNVR